MDARTTHVDFFFEGHAAGYFLNAEPASTGQCSYMPYRTLAHYRLGQAVTSAGPQTCYYVSDGKKRTFTVIKIPSYGVLDVAVSSQEEDHY